MRLKTKIWIGVGVVIAISTYLVLTSVIPNLRHYDLLERNNIVLKANQEFYKKNWGVLKIERDSLQTELDGAKTQIESLKNLKPGIVVQREKAKKLILGLSNEQLQDFYDKKAKELHK